MKRLDRWARWEARAPREATWVVLFPMVFFGTMCAAGFGWKHSTAEGIVGAALLAPWAAWLPAMFRGIRALYALIRLDRVRRCRRTDLRDAYPPTPSGIDALRGPS